MIAISIEYGLLFTGGYDPFICVWEISSFPIPVTPIAVLKGHKAAIQSLVVNQHYLYSGSADHRIKVWDISILSQHQRQQLRHPLRTINHHHQSPSYLYRPSQLERMNSQLSRTNTRTGQSTQGVSSTTSPLSPEIVLSLAQSTSVAVDYASYEVMEQKAFSTLKGHRKGVLQLLTSHGRLLSSSKDGSIQVRCL